MLILFFSWYKIKRSPSVEKFKVWSQEIHKTLMHKCEYKTTEKNFKPKF